MSGAAPKCSEIGNLFASQYYRHLVSSPDTAHNFYHAEAGFSRLRGSTPSETSGHDNIKAYIASYNYPSCKLKIDTIDSQEKGKNEIIVLVSGIEIDGNKVVRPFCQTFCLEAPSGTRYLVRNDILCYLRNELLNIGDQKVDAQPEAVENSAEESELKDEQPLPVHVDAGTQAEDISNSEPALAEESQPVPVEEPAQVQPTQLPKQQQKSTRADTKREAVDPSKPRPWSSLFSNGNQNNITSSETAVSNSEPSANDDEIVPTSTSAVTSVDKPKAAPRPEFVLNSLYVSNLSPGCDVEEVKELFSRFGKVKAVKYTSPQTYCFVDFDIPDSADKALKGGPLKLGDFDLKLERRKVNVGANRGGRGGWAGGSRGGARGRGASRGDSRPDQLRTSDRSERRETRPREGNDRSGGNRSSNKDERGGRGGRGRGGRGGATPTASS